MSTSRGAATAATDETVTTYVATWNESDPKKRAEVISGTWSPDGIYRNASTEYRGLDGVIEAVAEAYAAFSSKGFEFQVRQVDINHNAIRYQWQMVVVESGEVDSVGTHFAVVGSDGRLVIDYQFIDTPPGGTAGEDVQTA